MINNIILIDESVFEEIIKRLETLSKRVEYFHKMYNTKKLNDLLSSEQVCNILDIKPRTLQTYRETGKIGFSQIDRKIIYRLNDVDKLLKNNYHIK